MDGGGSSTSVMHGNVINRPTGLDNDFEMERPVGSIVCLKEGTFAFWWLAQVWLIKFVIHSFYNSASESNEKDKSLNMFSLEN